MKFDSIFKEGSRYRALFLSLLLCAIGSGLHKGILDNYVAEMAHMNELDRGIMEFFREVPGLLLILILASNVYVQDISDSQEEMRATISTGISVNHLITIFIALLGGWIWNILGIETLFIISAILGLLNSLYAATIKVEK